MKFCENCEKYENKDYGNFSNIELIKFINKNWNFVKNEPIKKKRNTEIFGKLN